MLLLLLNSELFETDTLGGMSKFFCFFFPFPVSSLLLCSPVFNFQIKCGANLYSWWKVLIAWEAERRFCSQDGRRRRRRADALNGPLFIFFFFCRSPSLNHPRVFRREKYPPAAHEAGIRINPDYIGAQVKTGYQH